MSTITRFPLCWPDNIARTAPCDRQPARFADYWTVGQAVKLVLSEINRINGRYFDYEDKRVIISTNVPLRQDFLPRSDTEPKDNGAAVYFHLTIGKQTGRLFERPVVLTCDKFTRLVWNIYAIGRDIEAQRARLRWGCATVEQAFRGHTMIPERTGGAPWWDVLGVSPSATAEQAREAFRVKAKTEHPDTGGSSERFQKLQEALNQAMARSE